MCVENVFSASQCSSCIFKAIEATADCVKITRLWRSSASWELRVCAIRSIGGAENSLDKCLQYAENPRRKPSRSGSFSFLLFRLAGPIQGLVIIAVYSRPPFEVVLIVEQRGHGSTSAKSLVVRGYHDYRLCGGTRETHSVFCPRALGTGLADHHCWLWWWRASNHRCPNHGFSLRGQPNGAGIWCGFDNRHSEQRSVKQGRHLGRIMRRLAMRQCLTHFDPERGRYHLHCSKHPALERFNGDHQSNFSGRYLQVKCCKRYGRRNQGFSFPDHCHGASGWYGADQR
jgi:hypothetical protein